MSLKCIIEQSGVIEMVMSMTGYGSDVIQLDNLTVNVEIKTVNNRFLDIVLKYPRSLISLEQDFRNIVQQYFKRGRIEVYMTIIGEQIDNRSLQVDWHLLNQYMDNLSEIKERYNIDGNIPMSIIPTFDGLFNTIEYGKLSEQAQQPIFDCLEKACKATIVSRKKEGHHLKQDICLYIDKTAQLINEIKEQQPTIHKTYQQRIQQRIEQSIDDSITTDHVQLLHEIALLAEKGDITEEVTRLISHVDHFNSVIKTVDVIGRKLDFILQEMHREVNTIGAKSVDKETSKKVVQLKSHIEKIKEQVQNIE